MKPGLDAEQLDARLLREIAAQPNRALGNLLPARVPARMAPVVCALAGVGDATKANAITRTQRETLCATLMDMRMHITGTRGFAEAVITRGGVHVREVDARTMQSKLVQNVYIIGELLDVDALTGGFNLQIAFSTGWCAGEYCQKGSVQN